MRSLTKDAIKVGLSGQTVTLRSDHREKKYHYEIPLDSEVDNSSPHATYINGIVELKIKRKDQPKSKSKQIKIE